MTSTADATRQIMRLAAMPKFAELGHGASELIRILREYALSPDHAERAMTGWLDTHRWLPTPAELLEQLDATPERDNVARRATARTVCDRCGYGKYGGPMSDCGGFEPVYVLVTYTRHPSGAAKAAEERVISHEVYEQLRGQVDGRTQIVAPAVRACSCEYGQLLLAARVARESEQKTRKDRGIRRGDAA